MYVNGFWRLETINTRIQKRFRMLSGAILSEINIVTIIRLNQLALWYRRLGHLNIANVKELIKHAEEIDLGD
jgi:hypothetical protein